MGMEEYDTATIQKTQHQNSLAGSEENYEALWMASQPKSIRGTPPPSLIHVEGVSATETCWILPQLLQITLQNEYLNYERNNPLAMFFCHFMWVVGNYTRKKCRYNKEEINKKFRIFIVQTKRNKLLTLLKVIQNYQDTKTLKAATDFECCSYEGRKRIHTEF